MLNTYYLQNLCELKFSSKATKTDLTISNKMIIFNTDTDLFFLDKELANIVVGVSPTTIVLPEIKERKEEAETKILKGENFTILCNKRTNTCVVYLLNTIRLIGKLNRLKLLIYGIETDIDIDVDKIRNLANMLIHENQYMDRMEYYEYLNWCEDNSKSYSNLLSLNEFRQTKIAE